MSVGPEPLSHTAAPVPPASLAGRDGELLAVRISVEPRWLEKLLDTLAHLAFPISPQIYHQAALCYVYADGGQRWEPTTTVEFPAYAGWLEVLKAAVEQGGFPGVCLTVRSMLEDLAADCDLRPAPAGSGCRSVIWYRQWNGAGGRGWPERPIYRASGGTTILDEGSAMPVVASHLSPFAGSWYAGEPGELRASLEEMSQASRRRAGPYLAPKPLAFVVPHAGLMYSGTVAAAAYRHLAADPPERVILLGFPHRGAAPGAFIPEVESYRTPLGETAVDLETVAGLMAAGGFRRLPESMLCDHSVEIQLPLLQQAAPQARVVPIYLSQLGEVAREVAARALAHWLGPGTVVLASSDFTHYGRSFGFQPFPPDREAAHRLREMDETVIEAASSLRPEMFSEAIRETQATVCGTEPISLLLAALRLADSADEIFQEQLDYQTSGEITGDYQQSVSYAALGYFRFSSFNLARADQLLLLDSAVRTLEHFQRTGERRPVPPERPAYALGRRAGAFVTLHQDGRLRGCVGRRGVGESLAEAIPSLTLAAALEDSRFPPLEPSERGLEIEISVLSPFKRVPNRDSFQAGVHGAYLEAGQRHALLLPQVASEAGWGARQFFDALARKAGLLPEVYRDPATRLYLFRAQILK